MLVTQLFGTLTLSSVAESVNTALGGVSPPTAITTHREWSTQLHTENPVDYTPVGQVIAPYVSLVAIFIAAIVIGYVTD